jgi:hypothetical protein
LLIVAAIAAVGAAVALQSGDGSEPPDYPYPFETFEDQGRNHIPPGQVHDGYNSVPPTSGPHSSQAAPWGVSDLELPKEVPVHNMEHGGVVVWYNCAGGPSALDESACEELRDGLAGIVEGARGDGKLVLMTAYSDMPHRIALTAWRTLDGFDEFDAARVRAFIEAFDRRFNPEGF